MLLQSKSNASNTSHAAGLVKRGLVFVEHARCDRVVVLEAGYIPLTTHNIA